MHGVLQVESVCILYGYIMSISSRYIDHIIILIYTQKRYTTGAAQAISI